MMGKTHISVGVASALLVSRPTDLGGCLVAVIGGSVGGIMCDIEVRSNRKCRDALHARYIVLALVGTALLVDVIIRGQVTTAISEGNRTVLSVGALILAGTSTCSRLWSKHRGFSHSILALALFSIGLLAIFPALAISFALGFASHVLLDVLNKKQIQLLYPSNKANICLRLCYANGVTNKVFLVLGVVGTVAGLAMPFVLAA
ncbi:metal-dependent hydrolase [Nocardioides sp. GY 10113]|uniref:metal-dependent hydrolase n=1 Tax=Nocardioides sp. GY 10113 TaxID=2569761 RepID=UPI0010A7B661|nr:metal-dependent hydrolase [Nocardioides sp. GY 10113]TIC87748.1 metal-dependent hydrolase [Nocardioides sp. GY 10113]